jgi:multidrug efflux pump subunit AcrA (membrane-fusion protein)
VGGGLGAWFATRSTPAASPTSRIVTVGTGTIVQSVATTGTIEPANQANLSFAVAGKVNSVDVTPGQVVTAGQTLATIDPTTLAASLAVVEAALNTAQAKLATDQSGGATAVQLAADQAAVTAAQASVSTAQSSFADATLTSPFAGTVAAVNLAVGQAVPGGPAAAGSAAGSAASSSSTSAASAQVVVIDTGAFVVSATVGDTQVGELAVGDQAVVTPSGATSNVYGTVASVGLVATQSSGVATFPVMIDVTGSPPGLYAGMTANVTIIFKELQGVVVVPTTALHYTTTTISVTVMKGGSAVSTPVTVGTSSAGRTQVTSGVTVGDQVVVPVVTFRRPLGGGAGAGKGGGFGGARGSGRGGALAGGGFGG